MATSHTVSGLLAKREALAKEAHQHRLQADQLFNQVTAIETALKVLDPRIDLRVLAPKRNYSPIGIQLEFARGECRRLIFDMLRDSPTPKPTAEIIDSIVAGKNLFDNRDQVAVFIKSTLDRIQQRIEALVTILSKHAQYLPDCAGELAYHQALVARENLDYVAMETFVENVTGEDPAWKLRQAALLMELGRFTEGDPIRGSYELASVRDTAAQSASNGGELGSGKSGAIRQGDCPY
jgi:hypothetical protein